MVISFMTINTGNRALEAMSKEQLSQLVRQIASNMEVYHLFLDRDLALLARTLDFGGPDGSFKPRSAPGSREIESDLFPDGPSNFDRLIFHPERDFSAPARPSNQNPAPLQLTRNKARGGWEAALEKPVPGDGRLAGYLEGRVPLERFSRFLAGVELDESMEKIMLDNRGRTIWAKGVKGGLAQTLLQTTREVRARVAGPDWTLVIRVPESVLFGEVNRQVVHNLVLAGFISLLATVAAFEFSRRTTNVLKQIIQGAKKFASGDLSHRIQIDYGQEARELAQEFNLMAARLKERQEDLMQYNKLAHLGLFSTQIAHELKNPLAGMKTSAQVLWGLASEKKADSAGSDPGRVWFSGEDLEDMLVLVEGINEETNRLNNILTRLMNFARPNLPVKRPSSIARIVARSVQSIGSERVRQNVVVKQYLEDFTVNVDPDQVCQVLINLLLNALAAVETDKGEIVVTSSLTNTTGRPVLSVADNGVGIPASDIGKIFDPFFSRRSGGYGLGLTIAYTLAKHNGIQLQVSSEEGLNTVFRLVFDHDRHQAGES